MDTHFIASNGVVITDRGRFLTIGAMPLSVDETNAVREYIRREVGAEPRPLLATSCRNCGKTTERASGFCTRSSDCKRAQRAERRRVNEEWAQSINKENS